MNSFTALRTYGLGLVLFLVLSAAWPQCASARLHWRFDFTPLLSTDNIFFTDAGHGVVIGGAANPGRAAIVWTRDGGRNWHAAKIRADVKKFNLEGVWFSSAKLGWADGGTPGWPNWGVLLKTTDGGRTWRRVALPKTIGGLNGVWFGPHGQHGRLLPGGGTVFWQTTDGGKTFKTMNVRQPFQGGWWIGSWEKMVLAGAGGQAIIRTNDAGKTWTKVATGLKGPAAMLSAISFAKGGKVGWAVGGQGKWLKNGGWWMPSKPVILNTTDGGKTWTVQKPPPGRTGGLTDVWAISPTQAWISSVMGYAYTNPLSALPWLLHTTNGGQTWPNVLHHLLSLRKLFFLNARHGWAVGGQGGSPDEMRRGVLIYGRR